MIKIHKIEVENVRSLGHAIFEPLADGGMTAVNGPNGAGKSSILAAMVWAIFGVTPDGVPQSAMRRQNSVGTCRVVVDFEYDQQIVTVERGLKGRNDSPYMKVSVNGVEQAFGKIRACEAWLVNLLGGLDAEGFLTAFVIRQKELDGLVKAKPAERRKLIERLAGIDRMSTAVKTAREEETEVKKRLELLPGDPDAVRAARQALDEAQTAAAEHWETYEAATEALDIAQSAFETAEATATAMQARIDNHAKAERALTEARHACALAAERVQAAQRELDGLIVAAEGGTDEEVASAQRNYDTAAEALNLNKQAREGADRAVEVANRDKARADQMEERATRARAAAVQAREAADAAKGRAAAIPADLDESIEAAERSLADLTQRRGALLGEHARLGASITAMEATATGDSCCPTCSTTLADPATVLASLRESQARVMTDGAKVTSDAAETNERLAALRQQAQQAQQTQAEARHLHEQAVTADTSATDMERDAAEARDTARESASAAEDAKAAALSAAQQTETLTAAVETTANALRTAQVAAAAAARVPEATRALSEATEVAAFAAETLEFAERDEAGKRVDPDEAAEAVQAFRDAQANRAVADRTKAEAHGNFRVAEEQVKSAEKTRDAEELRMRARAEAHELLEQKTAVREALDFFRKDRIASLAPELSEIATDSIAKMTDGKFVALELDEEFTPVVTDAAGNLRPATWLSGGEESAVALALRLAIGEVIAGQQGGLLWMDEPQTAMDASRRPAMMSVIRDLPGRQPIIISHVTEAADMVDLVLEVVPDDENGSTVVLTGTPAGSDASMLDAIEV